jgi:serine/threonine protein kinase
MKTLGKYQLLEEIGSGSAGTTYRARDTFRDSDVALKVLRSTAPTSKKEFGRELAKCAELQHRHMEQVHDLGEVDGAIYIAKELLWGMDLRQCLRQSNEWPLVQKLKFTAQICDGLAFAHRKGIVHGNLKPSNIFVAGNREARILDFGMASWPSSFPNYLSPEQILEQPFDERSDLFSVGILLYEFTLGVYPFQVPEGLIPREIVHGEPQQLRKPGPEIPQGLERLLLRALDKDPQRRLQSADEFAVSLYAIARQLQTEASEVSYAPAVAELVEGSWEAPAPHLTVAEPRMAVSAAVAGATGGGSPNPSISTAPASMQSTFVEHAPSPPAEVPSFLDDAERERQAAPSSKRLFLLLAGAAMGISLLGVLLTRQSTKASPATVQVQTNQPESAPPSAKPNEQPQPAALEVQKPPATVEPAEPQPKPEHILRGQVAALWDAGRYAQALKLVDTILANDPSHVEARAWKAKILEAQDAEASIK